MKLVNLIKMAIVAMAVSVPVAKATDQVGIVASISPNKQTDVSFAIDSRPATEILKTATNHPKSDNIYWLSRNNSDTYHCTLEIMKKADGSNFAAPDLDHLAQVLSDFKDKAKYLNLAMNSVKGKKAYRGKGYELRLFVHYTDGTHEQFNTKTIQNVLKSQKDIAYANLVLKLGTHGGLKKDWSYTRNQILTKPNHASFSKVIVHDLETHITIGNLFKYSKKQNKIVNGAVQRNNGKGGFNTPFLCGVRYEMQMLVDVFNSVNDNTDFAKLQNICLDRLQLTGKGANGQINVVREVKFN